MADGMGGMEARLTGGPRARIPLYVGGRSAVFIIERTRVEWMESSSSYATQLTRREFA